MYSNKENFIVAVEKAIDTLMDESHWAKDQNIDSLSKALKSEMSEFISTLELRDKFNILSEAGDVVMILLCCLHYQLGEGVSNFLPEIFKQIKTKLHRRFAHLYKSKQLLLFDEKTNYYDNSRKKILDRRAEDFIWEQSKKNEQRENFSYCKNDTTCKYAFQVGAGNMELLGNESLKCKHCNTVYPIREATLFPGRITSREKIINQIAKLFNKDSSIETELFYLNQDERRNVKAWIINSLQNERAFKDILEKRYGILKSETEHLINVVLKNIYYQKSNKYEKRLCYYARSWDNQKAIRFVLNLNKNQFIEAMLIYHYKDKDLRDITVEISNMHGCPIGCLFCASNNIIHPFPLGRLSYIKQINTCLQYATADFNAIDDFQVSFAGLGEPSIVAQDILDGALLILRAYPKVRFNLSTCGINPEGFEIWRNEKFPIRTIQISYFHHNEKKLETIFTNKMIPKFASIISKATILCSSKPNCRLKINYILIKGFNDDAESIDYFLKTINPFKENLSVKLSFLNPTTMSKRLCIESPDLSVFTSVINKLKDSGISCYIFGTNFDPMIGCGQLATQSYS